MKKCSKCGAEFPNDAAFCTNCGAPLEEAANTQQAEPVKAEPANEPTPATEPAQAAAGQPKKPNAFLERLKGLTGKSKIILGACCAVVLIAIIAIICAIAGGKKGKKVELGAIDMVYDGAADAYYVYNGYGKSKKIGSGDMKLNEAVTTYNGVVKVVVDNDKNSYVLTIKGLQKFAEDGTGFVISASGNAVAYAKLNDDNEYELYVYNVKSKKTEKVAKNVRSGFVISNNGKHICYVENTDDRAAFCAKNLKNKVSLGKGSTPIAVSDNGRFIYFFDRKDDEYNFCLKKGNSEKTVIQKNIQTNLFMFNRDFTQVIFSDGEKAFLAIKGNKTATIGKGSISYAMFDCPFNRVGSSNNISAMYFNVRTLKGGIVKVGSTNWYIKSNKEAVKVLNEENIRGSYYSFDGRSILYEKGDAIYLIPNVKNPERVKTVCNTEDYDVVDIYPSTDLKSFYFVTDDDELYFVKGSSKPKKIADDADVEEYDYITNTLYYFKDHTNGDPDVLYGTKNGSKNRKVLKECVDVDDTSGGYNVAYKVNAKDDDFVDLYVLSGYRAKNLKVKTEE
jgi:hypothetical protein